MTELVLRPLQELFKDDIVHRAALAAVVRGNAVGVRTAPIFLRAIGIPNVISGRRGSLVISQGVRIGLMIFFIFSLALFERSVNQIRVPILSKVSTTSLLHVDSLSDIEGRVTLMSPFPAFGLNEEEAVNISSFSPTGTNSNQSYIVREKSNLASKYISSCVRQINDTYTVAYVGAVAKTKGTQTIQCLDGSGGSDKRTAGEFFSDTILAGANITAVSLSRIKNDDGFSTDGVTGVYAAKVVDDRNLIYEGYIAITLRSHFDANVEWSMYGLVRDEGPFVYRVAMRLYKRGATVAAYPCFDEAPSLKYIGNWSFNGTDYKCPDGVTRPMRRNPEEELQTIALKIFPVSNQVSTQRNGDLLAWITETDFARFAAAETFALEMRTRVRSDRMFYSQKEGENLIVARGEFEEQITIGVWETVVLLVGIGTFLVSIGVSCFWKLYQRQKYRMDSDVVSLDSIARMYCIENTGNNHPGNCLLNIGLSDIQQDAQHLGIVGSGIASVRRPELALQ
ncbi:unnamed protein product [Agarophyton chilense]